MRTIYSPEIDLKPIYPLISMCLWFAYKNMRQAGENEERAKTIDSLAMTVSTLTFFISFICINANCLQTDFSYPKSADTASSWTSAYITMAMPHVYISIKNLSSNRLILCDKITNLIFVISATFNYTLVCSETIAQKATLHTWIATLGLTGFSNLISVFRYLYAPSEAANIDPQALLVPHA